MKYLNFYLKTICLVAMSFFIGAFACHAAASAASSESVKQVLTFLTVPSGLILAAFNFVPKGIEFKNSLFTITSTDVVTEWGLLYRNQGQGTKDIMLKLMQRSVTAQYFPIRVTNQTVLEKVTAEFTRVLQRFQKGYTPAGGTTFKPVKIPLIKLKIDLQETPDDLEESWLGFLAGEGLDRTQWPFIKWYLENAIAQAEKDLELNEIYFGVIGSITPGTATAAGTSLNGIKKQINDANTAGKLSLISMGAVPTDPVLYVEYVEDFAKQIPRLARNELDFFFVDEDHHDLFRDGMRLKYNVMYAQVDDTKITKLRNDNIQLVGLPSMAGSTKIWTTPLWNRQMGIKRPANEKVFEVEKVDRTVKAYTDYSKGFGFWILEYLYSQDVELS